MRLRISYAEGACLNSALAAMPDRNSEFEGLLMNYARSPLHHFGNLSDRSRQPGYELDFLSSIRTASF